MAIFIGMSCVIKYNYSSSKVTSCRILEHAVVTVSIEKVNGTDHPDSLLELGSIDYIVPYNNFFVLLCFADLIENRLRVSFYVRMELSLQP